jgi:Mg-chelatase subunit ChlD
MTRRAMRAAAVLVALGAGPPAAPAAGDPPVAGEETAQALLYSLRVRLRPARGHADGCAAVDAAELEVRLRGDELTERGLVELERERPPTVHALLIDASGSMIGHLDYVRDAAARYLERLDEEHDVALLATFDDDVLMLRATASHPERLAAAVRSVRMGGNTSVLDALAYVLRELATRRERRVLLLLTDGVDTASLNERHDVFDLLGERGSLRVFTIGLALPPLVSAAPAGFNSTRSFLQRLAERTGGEFFDAPRPHGLEQVYGTIRALVESEAILNVVDPNPTLPPGRLEVRSNRKDCRIEVLERRLAAPQPSQRVEPPWSALARRMPLAFGESWKFHLNGAHHAVVPACGGVDRELAADRARLASEAWFVEGGAGSILGCTLDVRMDTGPLYDPTSLRWWSPNGWLELETRPFHVELPPFEALPREPVEALDGLAAHARSVAAVEIATDPRKRPAERHARPHGDFPMLVSGRTFLEMRAGLARAAFLGADYRAWVLGRLEAEADEGVARLYERYRRRLPHVPEETLRVAARESEEGRGLVRDAREPGVEALVRHLAAWLGDLPAHDLFTAWEALHVERLLEGRGDPSFRERWSALRRVLVYPSYSRVLALLVPVRDTAEDRVGYWRVVLPRPAWFQPRLPGYRNYPEWGELPLDLVPDLPFGYLATARALETPAHPLLARLAGKAWRVERLGYRLTGKGGRHTPVQAFRDAQVTYELWPLDDDRCGLEVAAEVGLDRTLAEPRPAELRWRELGTDCP